MILVELLVSLLWWIILYPVFWVLATPVILIAAIFRPRPYWQAVRTMYRAVTDFWSEWAAVLTP